MNLEDQTFSYTDEELDSEKISLDISKFKKKTPEVSKENSKKKSTTESTRVTKEKKTKKSNPDDEFFHGSFQKMIDDEEKRMKDVFNDSTVHLLDIHGSSGLSDNGLNNYRRVRINHLTYNKLKLLYYQNHFDEKKYKFSSFVSAIIYEALNNDSWKSKTMDTLESWSKESSNKTIKE